MVWSGLVWSGLVWSCLVRRGHGDETAELYHEQALREQRGESDSSTNGQATVGRSVALNAMSWASFAGSLGVVAGEAIKIVTYPTIQSFFPLVNVSTFTGVSQHEIFTDLTQMTGMVESFSKKGKAVNLPTWRLCAGTCGQVCRTLPNVDLIVI